MEETVKVTIEVDRKSIESFICLAAGNEEKRNAIIANIKDSYKMSDIHTNGDSDSLRLAISGLIAAKEGMDYEESLK